VTWKKTPCRFCGVGCGLLVGVKEGCAVAVQGDPDSSVNKGLCCVKGYHSVLALYGSDLLRQAMVRKNGKTVARPDLRGTGPDRVQDEGDHQSTRQRCCGYLRLRTVDNPGRIRGVQVLQGLYRHEQRRGKCSSVHVQRGHRLHDHLRHGSLRPRHFGSYRRSTRGRNCFSTALRLDHRFITSCSLESKG